MKYLSWLLKAAIFFTLFAFALNNQEDVTVRLFFGVVWRAPLVLVVLAVFTLGVGIGVLGMVPRWWKHRRLSKQAASPGAAPAIAPVSPISPTSPTSAVPTGPTHTLSPDAPHGV
jgi:lipopolysaccharide assembly protein A